MEFSDIRIDHDLESLLPPLPDAALDALRSDIIDGGRIRESLVVWSEEGVLIEGHNRYRLYIELRDDHAIEEPGIIERSFPSRVAVMEWMIANQNGRRNWTATDAAYARGKIHRENQTAPELPADSSDNDVAPACDTNVAPPARKPKRKTAAAVGKERGGVSGRTVQRDAQFADAVDKIAQVNQKAGEDIRTGVIDLPKGEVVALANSGDISGALKRYRKSGVWRHPADIAADKADEAWKRVALMKSSYKVFAGHVAWLTANATKPSTKASLARIDANLKLIFDEMQAFKQPDR